ncbi:MarR family transcriptional regulator [Chryseobacterium shigense]|uniref:DNA-binding transcriptional regulator, MarR family n=1 Tax=Chryseobacterium shigense TaxID=297244 RepID=A0A1N7HXN4_9FLAO|nr:helix-turn-helix domain-containing protein [Chryseobacterium shigense]PQA94013.1 MarR family transcriptional regulator [Chryseobacterium shigense]SIS29562.1 DNA-binding transcriptional regulator, MarR family [Chryseobacterium shigense]
MNYSVVKDVIRLLEEFDEENKINSYPSDVEGFKAWLCSKEPLTLNHDANEPYWAGKENGRSAESAISTSLVHLNRYAKSYSKSAIVDSDFATQEDFIYLINLKTFGAMTKMELIKKNVHEKSVGMLIIHRLINLGLVEQSDSDTDKRTKIIQITSSGIASLENQMRKIRTATNIVAGDLSYSEKMQLIRILDKLEKFHHPIFTRNIDAKNLIEVISKEYSFIKN